MSFLKPDRESFGLLIVGLASVALLAAVGALIYSWSFVHRAARADGRVVQLVERQDGEFRTLYPAFTFRDAHGVEHRVISSVGSTPPDHRVGDAVRVLYPTDAPTGAKIDDFFSVWGLAFIMGLLGLFFLPFGILILKPPRILAKFGKQNLDAQMFGP